MSTPRIGVLIAALVCSSMMFISAAPATASVRVIGADTTSVIELGGPDGFLSVSRRKAYVTSSRGHRFTTFSAPARATRTALLARFGSLGRVDLSFEPTGRPSKNEPSSFCKGGTQFTWKGTFRGTVDLKGRYGFRPVHDGSFAATGSITRSPRLVCHGLPETPLPENGGDLVGLWAASCDGRGLVVRGRRPNAKHLGAVSFSASATRKLGRVEVTEALDATASPASFLFDEGLLDATVRPPAPFRGSGSVTRAADGTPKLSGSISAPLFGRQLPLAGPDFQAEFRSFPVSPGTLSLIAYSFVCPGGRSTVSRSRPPSESQSLPASW